MKTITIETLEKDHAELSAEMSRAAAEARLAEAKRDKLAGAVAYIERQIRLLKEPAAAPAPAPATPASANP